jgi:hypothetical protein
MQSVRSFPLAAAVALTIAGLASAAAQTPNVLPPVPTVRMLDTATSGLEDKYGLYQCSVREKYIVCDIGLTKGREKMEEYNLEYPCILTDNLKIDHKTSNKYFLNGRGQRQSRVRVAGGDWVWIEMEFEGGEKDITSGKIDCNLGNHIVLRWEP